MKGKENILKKTIIALRNEEIFGKHWNKTGHLEKAKLNITFNAT